PEQKKLDELVVRFKKHQADCMEQYGKATTDEERDKALERRRGREFVPEFLALADESPGTDAAGRALVWALRIGLEREPAREVVARLLEQHMESDVLAELPQELAGNEGVIGSEEVQKALSELIEYSPQKNVQGQALFVLGSKQIGSKDAAVKAAGRKALERVVADYAEFENYRGQIGEQAGGILFKLDKLQLGMVAPEMEAVDENGAKWKLSDYRGKVVLVDFWGYW
ncbi:MAG: hypothetical protein ABL998_19065, partial [Planctomycetota bacterium]